MAVFTGASSQAAHLVLQATGLLDAFAAAVTGDEVTRQQPHPNGSVRACAQLGVAPQAAADVCDAPTDLEAARRAGELAVAAGWGHQHREAALARSSWTSPTICSTLLVMHDLWVSECALQAR